MNQLIHKRKAPCDKCPYKLGQIQTVVNPCPQCKLNDYQGYEQFKKQLIGNEEVTENDFHEFKKNLHAKRSKVRMNDESIFITMEEKKMQEKFDEYGITTLTPKELLYSTDPEALLRSRGVSKEIIDKIRM